MVVGEVICVDHVDDLLGDKGVWVRISCLKVWQNILDRVVYWQVVKEGLGAWGTN
jgi:hypothetical protein